MFSNHRSSAPPGQLYKMTETRQSYRLSTLHPPSSIPSPGGIQLCRRSSGQSTGRGPPSLRKPGSGQMRLGVSFPQRTQIGNRSLGGKRQSGHVRVGSDVSHGQRLVPYSSEERLVRIRPMRDGHVHVQTRSRRLH